LTCTRVVSKADGSQSLDLQRDVLETAGVGEVDCHHDLASGVRDDPAGPDRLPALCKGMYGRLVFGIFAALAEGELIRAVTAVRPIRLARRSPLARRDVVAPAHRELLDLAAVVGGPGGAASVGASVPGPRAVVGITTFATSAERTSPA